MKQGERLKERAAEFWNANPCGGDWDSYNAFLEWYRHTEPYFYDILDRYNWHGKQVLEVGCGQGTSLNYLPRFGATITGLDMSARSLRRAHTGAVELGYLSYVRLTEADAERLPFPDNHFDIVISAGVLHHTPNPVSGIKEIYRLLKPGGTAIVMLYRSGNLKWWFTNLLRTASHGIDIFTGKPNTLAERLRSRQQPGQVAGTALLELFGVPVLKAFSNRESRQMFAAFSEVCISNHQPGFRRLADILPILRPLRAGLEWIDHRTQASWGFYQVIEARK